VQIDRFLFFFRKTGIILDQLLHEMEKLSCEAGFLRKFLSLLARSHRFLFFFRKTRIVPDQIFHEMKKLSCEAGFLQEISSFSCKKS